MPPKLTTFPLADLFETVGMELTCRLMEEVQHLEPLAARFCEEFPQLPKRRRNPAGAARMIQDQGLEVRLFKDLLVASYSHHMKRLAQLKQAEKIANITEVSTVAAMDTKNFDERREHLRKADIFEKEKSGVSVNTNVGILNQPAQLPTFENEIMQIESKMRNQLPAATTDFIDVKTEKREEVPA
jgi:hypothetical protein